MKFGNDKITRASIMNSSARIGRKAKAQMKNEDRKE
jgi:DNA polymerase-4